MDETTGLARNWLTPSDVASSRVRLLNCLQSVLIAWNAERWEAGAPSPSLRCAPVHTRSRPNRARGSRRSAGAVPSRSGWRRRLGLELGESFRSNHLGCPARRPCPHPLARALKVAVTQPICPSVLFQTGSRTSEGHMSDEKEVQAETGLHLAIPSQPLKVWAGQGSGLPCAFCHQPIAIGEIEYEVDVLEHPPYVPSSRSPLRFHVKCHDRWRCGG
jgi:hypothetical protein